MSGDSTDDPVAHTYRCNLITSAIDGGSDLVSIERRGGRHHRGSGVKETHVAHYKVRGASGGQEHRQPLRRASDGVLGLCQLARRAGLGGVRDEGGAEGSGEDDGRAGGRRELLRLYRVEIRW